MSRRPMAGQALPLLAADDVLAAQATGDPKWSQRAACATGHDRELWFPETNAQAAKARQVCAGCPVVGDCRDAFLDTPVRGLAGQEMDRGIWAGLRGSELRETAHNHGITRAWEVDRYLHPDTAARRNDGRPARPTRGRPARPGAAAGTAVAATGLARILEDRDLPNAAVARAAGVSENALGRWARGDVAPTATSAAAVAAVLDVPPERLFTRVTADPHPLPPTLREALDRAGLTLPAAQKAAGLGNKTVYRWLDGSRTPTTEAADKLAAVLDVAAADLFPNLHTPGYQPTALGRPAQGRASTRTRERETRGRVMSA